jgi:hypothetical protein
MKLWGMFICCHSIDLKLLPLRERVCSLLNFVFILNFSILRLSVVSLLCEFIWAIRLSTATFIAYLITVRGPLESYFLFFKVPSYCHSKQLPALILLVSSNFCVPCSLYGVTYIKSTGITTYDLCKDNKKHTPKSC